MTRITTVAVAAFVLASCSSAPEVAHTRDAAQGPADAQMAEPSYVVGVVERDYLNDPAWPAFTTVYDTSRIESEYLDMIRATYKGEEFLVFFGAWCGDSKRDLPRFLRIADEAGFPPAKITLYSLDRTKMSADGTTERYGIQHVPTFIVLKNGAEVGRITEFPQVSVEADLLTILAAVPAR